MLSVHVRLGLAATALATLLVLPEALALGPSLPATPSGTLSGATPVDWREVERLAALPSFRIAAELQALKREVAGECA